MAKIKQAKIVRINPSSFGFSSEKEHHTKYIRRKSGLMAGRRTVPAGFSDRTKVIRLTRDIDLNKDGKIDNRDLKKGQIIARSSSGEIKPDYIEVERHTRNGARVRKHFRKRK